MYPILATPRNKIEELQQRKEADLKAQLARTQKLQQELEAANQVMGPVPKIPSGEPGLAVGGRTRSLETDWDV